MILLRRAVATGCGLLVATGVAWTQAATGPNVTQALRAAVVLTPEFCKTGIEAGSRFRTPLFRKERFDVGKAACLHLERSVRPVFASIVRVESAQQTAGISTDLVLVPKFVDLNATWPDGPAPAFSDRELIVLLEWTVTDGAGRTVWVETVRGTAVRKTGTIFSKQRDRLVEDAVLDLLRQSAIRMSNSPVLRGPAH